MRLLIIWDCCFRLLLRAESGSYYSYTTFLRAEKENECKLFAIVETNAFLLVLLVTFQYYDDGSGNQASIYCHVYYVTDKEVKKTGAIESLGTAYPVVCDKTGIYAASG